MFSKNYKAVSSPGTEGEGLSSWEGEERQEKKVISCGLERQSRARSCWAWMFINMRRDLDFILILEAISNV